MVYGPVLFGHDPAGHLIAEFMPSVLKVVYRQFVKRCRGRGWDMRFKVSPDPYTMVASKVSSYLSLRYRDSSHSMGSLSLT